MIFYIVLAEVLMIKNFEELSNKFILFKYSKMLNMLLLHMVKVSLLQIIIYLDKYRTNI